MFGVTNMYHQRKLAVAVSAALAISVLSGCSTNNTMKKSSSYEHAMGDVEFHKAAHLLMKSNPSQVVSQGANIQKASYHPIRTAVRIKKASYHPIRTAVRVKKASYHPTRTAVRVKKASYHPTRIAVRVKKASYHPTRIERPRKIGIVKDLEKAAVLLGVRKKPRRIQAIYRPAKSSQVYRPQLIKVANLLGVNAKNNQARQQFVAQQAQTQVQQQLARGNDNMWHRIYRGQKMGSYAKHPKVRRFIRHYASNPERLNRITKRASNYLFMVVAELERRRMPTELALLPFVESAYVNTARSHAAAAGMWQFIPSTGRLYGLKQRRGYDGRMDSFEATRAALDYLQKLNRDFNGDWFLSLAAYNAGEGRVQRAIDYNRRKGRPTNYWSLLLPKETKEYVPRLLAYKEIIHHPERYGIRLPRVTSRPALVPVWVNKVIDLRKVAREAGLPTYTLTALNPSYLRGITTPRLSKRIILPARYAGHLHHIIRKMPSAKDANYRYARYTKRYSKKHSSKRYKKSKRSNRRVITHRIRRGETLYKIALRHGTTVQKIMRMNKLRSSKVQAGRRLKIASNRSGKSYS